MIQPNSWVKLLYLVPDDFKQLVGICYEFEDTAQRFEYSTNIDGYDISRIQILIQAMLTEYMKIFTSNEQNKELIGHVRNDVYATLSNWFDSKSGNIKDLSNHFMVSQDRGQLQFHVPLYATPSLGFSHSRVYWSIIDALKTANSLLPKYFVVETITKNVNEKDWIGLSKIMFKELCLGCKEFEERMGHLYSISPVHNDNLLKEVNRTIIIITEEYLKIVGERDKALRTIQTYEDFEGFVNSVYYFLLKARDKRDAAFRNSFIQSTKQKAGIYPERRDDKFKLPPGPKDDEFI